MNRPTSPGKHARSKGQRRERELVRLHQDAGVPAEKLSRTGYAGPDVRIADAFLAEVKARASGEGFATIARWLGDANLLFLMEDRRPPLVVLPWAIYLLLLKAYKG